MISLDNGLEKAGKWLQLFKVILFIILLIGLILDMKHFASGLKLTNSNLLNFPKENKQTASVQTTTKKQPKISLSIPALKINVPIITGVDPSNEKKYDEALKKGVLLMPGTGEIGKPGNVFIYGHSSSSEFGNYNTVFTKINNLKNNDEIKITKDGKDYFYKVTGNKIIEANDLSVLAQTKDQTLTLMTCWPIGTDKQRLIVVAERKK